MKQFRCSLRMLLGISLFALSIEPAQAQTIDYGSLEALFGEPATTSATGTPLRSTDVPVTMEIITAEDIRRSGAVDIPTILSRYAGINTLAWFSGQTDAAVRGYNAPYAPRMLVLVNGRQVYLDFYGYTACSTIPVQLEEIRQIEVVKGPNSALFGFNAAAGVVNIITYNPLYDDTNVATARVGTQDYAGGSGVAILRPWDNTGIRLSVGGNVNEEFEAGLASSQEEFADDFSRFTFNANGIVQARENVQVRLEASRSSVEQTEVAPRWYEVVDTDYYMTSFKGEVAADTDYGLINFTAYTNYVEPDIGGDGSVLEFENRTNVFKLEDLFKIGADHTFRLGSEYRRNKSNVVPDDKADVSYEVFAGSGMWNWNITPQWAFTGAGRIDHLKLDRTGPIPATFPLTNDDWDRDITEWSANAGLVFKATDLDTFRVAYGRGLQLPSLVEFGAVQIEADPVGIMGLPTLDTTVVTNYEVGYDRRLPSLDAEAGIRLFYQENEDLRSGVGFGGINVPPTDSTVPLLTWRQVGDSSSYGFELTSGGRIAGGFTWDVDYTFQKVDDDLVADAQDLLVSFEDTTPVHMLDVHGGWANEDWEIDLFGSYVSSFDGFPDTAIAESSELIEIDGYFTFAGRVGYWLTDGVQVAVSGQNLITSPQQQTSLTEAERRAFLTLTANF